MKKSVHRTSAAQKSGKKKQAPKKTAPSPRTRSKSLTKKYSRSSPVCKVTFRLPREAAPDAQQVSIVGDFNNWNISENRMEQLKSGDFKLTLDLPCSREYRFRYLIDATRWENDWFADKYIPNEYGSDDSVVVIDASG